MRLLLDTNVWLLYLQGSSRIGGRARTRIDAADEVFVSAASVWEVAIKAKLGKLHADAQELLEISLAYGHAELPIVSEHALRAAALPPLHSDPFDRLLVAQALTTPLRLLTTDATLLGYSELVELL
jgi:PIN domain nuclease of toxin-antitoxin system